MTRNTGQDALLGRYIHYIENLGQNSLYTGYWKVYHDLEKAKATFTSFQEAREEAVREYLLGRAVVDIARQAQ
ncbi:hypothetical protein M2146_002845 [Lachnospiraceae bacterium PF1-22]